MRRRIILESGVKTEKVTVQVTMSDGASAQGITVTINGSATTTNADGVAYGEVPYDTNYSVVFSQKDSTYSTPATQSFTASQDDRTVTATYTKYYETCVATSSISATITINGNSKNNTKRHSVSIPYGTTYTISISNYGYYRFAQTSYTYTAGQSSRSVTFSVTKYGSTDVVDFSLPSGALWATQNPYTSSPEEYGCFFMYGHTNCYSKWDDYYTGLEDPLSSSADAVTRAWGSPWHIGTRAQWNELLTYCTCTSSVMNGVNGYTVSRNGKSIFFPSGGEMWHGKQGAEGSRAFYWTSTPGDDESYEDWKQHAVYVDLPGKPYGQTLRFSGMLVRGVIG